MAAAQEALPRIKAAAQRIDRILVCKPAWEKNHDPDKLDTPIIEVTGNHRVRELFDAMDLEHAAIDGLCDCVGQVRLVFMTGEDYRFEATMISSGNLQAGNGAPWDRELVLSPRGAAGVRNWLESVGYEELSRGEAEAEAQRRLRAAETARLIGMLPETARALLQASKTRRLITCDTLLDHYSDRTQGILSLWKVLAAYHTSPAFDFHLSEQELGISVLKSLDRASSEELQAARTSLAKTDNMERAGACLHGLAKAGKTTSEKTSRRWLISENAAALFQVCTPASQQRAMYSLIGDKDAAIRSSGLEEFDRTLVHATTPTLARTYIESEYDVASDMVTDLLFTLHEQDPASARERIPGALASKAVSEQGRRALKKLQAFISADVIITPELLRDGEGNPHLAKIAWQRLHKESGDNITLPLLAAAATSRSVYVSARAKELLAAHGLQPHEPRTIARWRGDLFLPPLGNTPQEQLAYLNKALKDATNRAEEAEVHYKLGQFQLRQGRFTEALLAFRKAGAERSGEATIAALSLGRLETGSLSANLSYANPELAASFMEEAALAHMTGDNAKAARYFELAMEVGYGDITDSCSAAAELCRRLAGRPASPEYAQAPAGTIPPSPAYGLDWAKLYLQGIVDRESFLRHNPQRRGVLGDAFSWWVVAARARAEGDKTSERSALEAGAATNDYANLWYPMINYRLRQLREE